LIPARVDVDAEARLAIVPEGKALIETEDVVLLSALSWVRLIGVLAEVFHPKRRRVADLSLLVFKARDADAAEFIARCAIELRHVYLLGRNRVAKGCGNVFLNEGG
jgi:hypothetical protein